MKRMTFWAVLGLCLLAAIAVYSLRVAGRVASVREASSHLEESAERAVVLGETAVGPSTMETLERRQKAARDDLGQTRNWFKVRDDATLDRWFGDLKTAWGKNPNREDFKRQYLLARDRLVRDVTRIIKARGDKVRPPGLIDYDWLQGDGVPELAHLARIQRAFRVQAHVAMAAARTGGWIPADQPLDAGDEQSVPSARGGPFARLRYFVKVRCRADRVGDVLHMLDAPFEIEGESGSRRMELPVTVDNVFVTRVNMDPAALPPSETEPPVEVTFLFSVLDYRQDVVRGS